MSRHPPPPPPKPKGYQLPAVPAFSHNNPDSAPPPQDSDTDSGICADSDQSSPRHPVASSHFPHYNHPQHVYRQQLAEDRDYLTPNCARKLLVASEVSVLSPRRLPPRPSTVAGQIRTGKQQFRVRFADEVNSGASTSSSSSEQSNTSPRQPEPIPNYSDINAPTQYSYFTKQGANTNNNSYAAKYENDLEKRIESLPRVSSSRRLPHASYSIEDVESLPEPPSYAIAVQRLRASDMPRESIRDTVIRQNVQDAFNRQFRNRSSSLPRGTRRESSELRSATDRLIYDYQMNRLFPDEILGSLDNLNIHSACGVPLDDMTFKRRKLPVAPLMGSATNIPDAVDVQSECGRQPALMRQRRLRGRMPAMMSKRSASVGRYPMERIEYEYRSMEGPSVRAKLVALDQRGFRTVLVEKTQPGPFGFYIATGVMNGQRGIFISRVSLPSLSPMLSVGDEILYVDDELVKGRSLEHVQSLIAGKTRVVIVLLPSVGPALC